MVAAHRPTLKKGHKPFKSKHATKSSIKKQNKGKIEKVEKTVRQDDKVSSGSTKQIRKNKANQIKNVKNAEVALHKTLFEGRNGAPKVVAVIPLSEDCNAAQTIIQINESVEATVNGAVPTTGVIDATVDRFKQKLKYIVPNKNLIEILDAARVADFVIFLLSPVQEVDEFGELCIRSIESQGVSNCLPLVCNLESTGNAKKQADVRASLLSYFSHFFPTTDKLYAPEITSEALNVARMLCQKLPQGVIWRDARPYMVVDRLEYDHATNTVAVEGVLRGQGLLADRLVHLPEIGDFQLDRIEDASLRNAAGGAASTMDVSDDSNCLARASENQESLDIFPTEQDEEYEMDHDSWHAEQEQTSVRMDGFDYMRDIRSDDDDDDNSKDRDIKRLQRSGRKLPEGMSEYQAAWVFDEDLKDQSEEEEDDDGNEEMQDDQDEDGRKVQFADADDEAELSLEEEQRQLVEFRNRAKEDLDFPDEFELRPDEFGRERLKAYRGVRSLRTARWDAYETDPRTPDDWARLVKVGNFAATKHVAMKEVISEAQVQPGQRIIMHIKAPIEVSQAIASRPFFVVYGLLKGEHLEASMNYTISPNSEYDLEKNPIVAKSELIMQCGPRRLIVRPLYSQSGNNSPNNVYKYERFLVQGRPSTATLISPLTLGNTPVLFFRDNGTPTPDLVATGGVLDAAKNRILARRMVLTGHPLKIHKRLVTIRYMFFNPEDVIWFKEVPLFTKSGRVGYIKESLGTHGYFKATFEGKITSQDVVGMALYKRVWPRASSMWSNF